MTITVEIHVGKDAAEYIDYVSQLRIDIFKEYPYLYEGELEYEKQYMHGYTTDKKSMIAVAKVNGELAGVSTGIPLISDSEIVADAKNVFAKQNVEVGDYYYYGEVIVLPKFRGHGITTKLYSEQNQLIQEWGFKHVCILTVVREENHSLKPKDYKSPDGMWKHLGFFRNDLTIDYHWPTIHPDKSVKDVNNTLEFWTKNLSPKKNSAAKNIEEKKHDASYSSLKLPVMQ